LNLPENEHGGQKRTNGVTEVPKLKTSADKLVVNFVEKVSPFVTESDVVDAPQTHERGDSEDNSAVRF